jgi:hypothetical protein
VRFERALGALALTVSAAAIAPATAAQSSEVVAGAASPARPAAVVIERGSVAASQVVALGRDLVVEGRAASGVAVVRGSARVDGEVGGDVVVLGGDAELEAAARVDGDVFVLGGAIRSRPGAQVRGRSVAYPTAPAALLVLAEGPALGLSPWSRVVVGTKLALLAAWLITAMALVAMAWPALASTADAIADAPLRAFTTGLVAVIAMLLGALFLATFLGVEGGVPLLVLLLLGALVLKLWGTVAVCAFVGGRLLGRGRRAGGGADAHRRRWSPLVVTLCGLMVLGAFKFVPWVGVWAWTTATLVGVGASLLTKLGRREPWLLSG